MAEINAISRKKIVLRLDKIFHTHLRVQTDVLFVKLGWEQHLAKPSLPFCCCSQRFISLSEIRSCSSYKLLFFVTEVCQAHLWL